MSDGTPRMTNAALGKRVDHLDGEVATIKRDLSEVQHEQRAHGVILSSIANKQEAIFNKIDSLSAAQSSSGAVKGMIEGKTVAMVISLIIASLSVLLVVISSYTADIKEDMEHNADKDALKMEALHHEIDTIREAMAIDDKREEDDKKQFTDIIQRIRQNETLAARNEEELVALDERLQREMRDLDGAISVRLDGLDKYLQMEFGSADRLVQEQVNLMRVDIEKLKEREIELAGFASSMQETLRWIEEADREHHKHLDHPMRQTYELESLKEQIQGALRLIERVDSEGSRIWNKTAPTPTLRDPNQG